MSRPRPGTKWRDCGTQRESLCEYPTVLRGQSRFPSDKFHTAHHWTGSQSPSSPGPRNRDRQHRTSSQTASPETSALPSHRITGSAGEMYCCKNAVIARLHLGPFSIVPILSYHFCPEKQLPSAKNKSTLPYNSVRYAPNNHFTGRAPQRKNPLWGPVYVYFSVRGPW